MTRPAARGGLRPEVIAFDLYGTLLDVASIEAACHEVTSDPAALVDRWRRKQLEYTWLRSLMRRYRDFREVTEGALNDALAEGGLTVGPAARRGLLDAWLRLPPFPEVPGALERLAERAALVVLTNGTAAMAEAALAAAGLRDRFAHVLSADEVGTYKPDPAVYALPAGRLGVSAERLLFVSANAWDVAGARSAGLAVAWLNRAARAFDGLDGGSELEVPDLAALADRVLASAAGGVPGRG